MPAYHLDPLTGIYIKPERDNLLTPVAKTLLAEKYQRSGESTQEAYARACKAWSGGDQALAQRLYDAVSQRWFMFASPVLSNAPLPGEKAKGMPISCFLTHVEDSLESIIEHSTEVRWLSVKGGGVGGHWRIRGSSDNSPGAIPFIKTMDSDMEAYRQGKTRRGSYAAYMDISHPDFLEFLALRREGAGDAARKCHSVGFHHGVNITDAFMAAVDSGETWNFIDPHDGSVRSSMPAKKLWEEMLEVRLQTGEPYLFFIDAARRAMPESQKKLGLNLWGSNLCSEITLATNHERTAVCCLSSLNAETWDEWKETTLVADLTTMLDNILTFFIEHAPDVLSKAKFSAMRERSLGLGMLGFHSLLQRKHVPFDSQKARKINHDLFMQVKVEAICASRKLAQSRGEAPDMEGTGMRNAHLLAIAPNANSGILIGTSPSIEPWPANAFVQDTRIGSHLVKNPYLEKTLIFHGRNDSETWTSIILNAGSVQHLEFLSDEERALFKTAFELDQMWVIRHAADRQPFICQAQSVNLFFPPRPDRAYINRVHLAAHAFGLKSLYYLRSLTKNRGETASKKVERVALKDAAPESADCEACSG